MIGVEARDRVYLALAFGKYHHACLRSTMDAAELARWTRFAAKGGIGKCTAIHDCVAESAEDLMFLKVIFFTFQRLLDSPH